MPTLLLADDSLTIQRVIELTFADEDVRVVAVSTGEQAIAAMAASPPDIVLADAAMPGRSGYDVAEHMRQTPSLASVPVLLLTGAFEPVDQARADAARCAGVLVKPFEPQQLIARVQELLTRPAGAPADIDAVVPSQAIAAKPSSPQTPSATSVDEYFDRLDRALGGSAQASADQTGNEALAAWFASKATAAAAAPRAAPAPARSAAGAPPLLADAFLALLDAERTGDAATPGPTPEPSSTFVEEVAARVLERLSDHVVRTAVSDVVSAIAERLVQEEIDRIKAAVAVVDDEGGQKQEMRQDGR